MQLQTTTANYNLVMFFLSSFIYTGNYRIGEKTVFHLPPVYI